MKTNNRIFVIADTHFGHKKVIDFESKKRPFKTIEEHDRTLIENWNSVVSKRDTVYHLGDVLFGRNSFKLLKELNGIKKLVLGNHDSYPIELYKEYFTKIFSSVLLKGSLMTHIPIHETQFRDAKINVHGHLHSSVINDPRYKCVSVEHTNLKPVLLEGLIFDEDWKRND